MVIKNINLKNINDLVYFCIPSNKKNAPRFILGAEEKRKWALAILKKYGEVAKLAYANHKPVGMIQYQPDPKEKVVKIRCIFVPDKEYRRKGIGRSLLNSLLKDMHRPKAWLNNKLPLGLITNAFETSAGYSQYLFYKQMGFITLNPKTKLLYYPLKKEYVYKPHTNRYKPIKEDENSCVIFFDPFCPYSLYFSTEIKNAIKEIAPILPIRLINKFEEPNEVIKRGNPPFCIINKKPIRTFILDKNNFIKEVKKALDN
ncbi:MAG: GNAT family N-acetyltransferase [candidate division WOR-3 bacterium]